MGSMEAPIAALSALPEDALMILAPIENEGAYEAALNAEEVLSKMVRNNKSHPLGGIYRTVLQHITVYEEQAYPTPDSPPHEILAYLLEQRGIRQSELAETMGITQGTVSRLVSGKMKFTAEWIQRLAKALHVNGSVFLEDT